jgi:hypothetical protein
MKNSWKFCCKGEKFKKMINTLSLLSAHYFCKIELIWASEVAQGVTAPVW